MSVNEFINDTNLRMLNEIIFEDQSISKKSREELVELNSFIKRIIPQFYEKEKKNQRDLINMNKLFLEYVFSVIHGVQGTQKKPIITNEQIKEQRQNQFERDLEMKKKDFSSIMDVSVPERPKFEDSGIDGPQEEIDVVMKRVMAQRNMDINQTINYKGFNTKQDIEKWLKPSETSVKTEKHDYSTSQTQSQSQKQQKIKYIKIDNEIIDNTILKNQVIDLNEKGNKQVTWGEVKEYNEQQTPDIELFSKLKRVDVTNPEIVSNTFVNPQVDNVETIETQILSVSEQVKSLTQSLGLYMDKYNNSLTILYNLLTKQEKDIEYIKSIIEDKREKVFVRPDNSNNNILI